MADVGSARPRRCAPPPLPARPTTNHPGREANPKSEPAPQGLPLEGVRIVDLTAFWAGPAATHLLAAFGADVVKVESIQRPDGIRYSGGMRTDVDDWWEYGWVFHAMNTNKRSVTLDLGSEEGARLFIELAAGADVVIENFSPRVMDHFGLTADVLLEVNPKLVVARMPAFGLDGPWRERVGFAPTMEQIAGLAWVTGLPEAPPVTPRGACDPLAGVHAAFAVLAALNFAERTGSGQLVELPMLETVLNATAIQAIESEVFGVTLSRRGNRGHGGSIQNLYRCAGDDDWIAVTVRDDEQWHALVDLMDRPAWCDEGLATVDGRRRARRRHRSPAAGLVRRAAAGIGGGAPGRRGHSRRPGGVAVVGDREPAAARPGILRGAGSPEHRCRPLSLPAVRPAGRPDAGGCFARRRGSASTMERCCAIGAG